MTHMIALQYYLPDKTGLILLRSLEEILGAEELDQLLIGMGLEGLAKDRSTDSMDRRFTFDAVSQLQVALENHYGACPGQGLAFRVGRGAFKYLLQEFSAKLGFNDYGFRFLPTPEKVTSGLLALAGFANEVGDQSVSFIDVGDHYLWTIGRCPVCWGRKSASPACSLAAGTLQESLYWLSNGKHYPLEETHCMAKGDPACVILIDKYPLE